jgi:hypothetical protein
MPEINKDHTTKNLISLKDYIDFRIEEVKVLLCEKLNALEKATSLAKENMEIRLTGMNEWRGQSKDREETFARKEQLTSLQTTVRDLELWKANLSGRASQASVFIAYGISIVSLIIGIVGILN